jgi:hypothetical protein
MKILNKSSPRMDPHGNPNKGKENFCKIWMKEDLFNK